MKVAFVHPDLGIGGAERLVLDVAVALKSHGVDVMFITNHFDKSHAFEELKDGQFPVQVFGDWIPRSIFGRLQALCAYIRMYYLAVTYMILYAHNDRPDVYFVDQIPMANFILKLFGQNIIYYCHHPDLLATPREHMLKTVYRMPIDYIEELGTKMADIILVNSEYTASVFYKTFPSIKKRINVLYPTIASSYIDMIGKTTPKLVSELVPEIMYNRSDIIFLSINRYHPAKQLELAIEAMDSLKSMVSSKDWAKVHLIMAGGYDPQYHINKIYFDKLVKLSEIKNLTGKVIFLKSPSDTLKADLLLACDCLIYTPINEHFGIVPLEAMAAAKPVIACNSGGPCETVDHNLTGYLSEPTPSAIAKFMKEMLDKDNSKMMGVNGKERLEAKFSYNAFSTQAIEVVKKIVDFNNAIEERNKHDNNKYCEGRNVLHTSYGSGGYEGSQGSIDSSPRSCESPSPKKSTEEF